MAFSYEYERPAVTVDCVIFAIDYEEENLKLLLIKRGEDPFKGKWALPGGFVRMDETLEKSAERELKEETGVEGVYLEQLYTFGNPGRDPRDRVVSVAYFALVNIAGQLLCAASDASDAAWFAMEDVPPLAFDHQEIIDCAIKRLQGKLEYQPLGFELLPEKFTLTQLQKVYEIILETELDKRNFRKKIFKLDVLEELEEIQKDVAHRAARLYRFDRQKYRERIAQGLSFEI